jgi:pimeloyl-ACP methyl ester carboxylesterase
MTAVARHFLVCLAWLACDARASAQSIVQALEPLGRIEEVAHEEQAGWQWRELALFDETYPLTVDVVASTDAEPSKIVYFFPGGGTNFHAAYFMPHDDNLAHYFREHGYLVIGITPREERVPASVSDQGFAAAWGIAKHRADVRRVIEAVQAKLGLPYEVLGHSYGGSLALDYGATYSGELQRLTILDIYAFGPEDVASLRNADRTYAAYDQLLRLGVYLEPMGSGLADLATWTDADRQRSSGFPRAWVSDHRGNFTNAGLYYYTLIETATLPGTHTVFSGLASDWPMRQGIFAGSYTFAEDPADDRYALTFVDEARLVSASAAAGSGLVPAAFSRDYWAAVAGSGAYAIDWTAIQCPLTWLNTGLGYGEQFYGAIAARDAGNGAVTTHVAKGYGHSDIFLGRSAREDVWPLLIP